MATAYPTNFTKDQLIDAITNARTPLAHKNSHKSGQADALSLTDLAIADNVTTNNATVNHPGLLKTLSGVSTQYMDGSGNWSTPAGSGGAGITLPGSSAVYYNGLGGWTTPSASGSVFRPFVTIGMGNSGADYICDGTADHVQFSAMFSAIPAGSVVYVLPGNYTFTTQVTCSKSVTLIGFGIVNIRLNTGVSNTPVLQFCGASVTSQDLTVSSAKGATTVTILDADNVQAGDLIEIHNNVKWCPNETEAANQLTGEMYEVLSVSGNEITLTQQLMRAYSTGDSSTARIFRPIEVHMDNISFTGNGSGSDVAGVRYQWCKRSSITRCKFFNHGRRSLLLDGCYDLDIDSNYMTGALYPGTGYGVAIYNACTFVKVTRNRIENCRHCVMAGVGLDFQALNRGIVIDSNYFVGGSVNDSMCIDAHAMTIDYTVTNNKIYPKSGNYAVSEAAQCLIFANNEIYGAGGIRKRGNVPGNYSIISNNYHEGDGAFYYSSSSYEVDTLIMSGNRSSGGTYGIQLNSHVRKQLIISNNLFDTKSNVGIFLQLGAVATYPCNVKIADNIVSNITTNGIYVRRDSDSDIINASITGNIVQNVGSANVGIYLVDLIAANVSGNTVINNTGSAGKGISEYAYLSGGCNYNNIVNNVLKGCTTAIDDVGANTVSTPNMIIS